MEKGSRFDGKMKMEYDTLLVISAMRCKNIVQLVSFYTWRQEINFIFPFVEGNLEKLLRGEWSPTGLPSGPQQMPYHWLWKQMIGVADALHWIHEPTVPENLKGRLRGSKIIAFHLDLKPANILISRDAILQITDFGQSMIKMVPQGTSEYGIYIGGDQAYQPPESSVSRGGVNRLSFITNEIPLDHARSASSAPFKIEDLHESLKIDSNFDVWSLACIMVEVLVYISKNGKDGFLEFERTRQAEMPAVPFHKNGENGEKFLKECVELTLERLGNGNIAWATPNSSNEPQLLYMDALTTLIAEMFKVDPKLRPDSWKVAQKLKDLDTEFNDNNGILLSKLDNALEKEGTPEDFMS
jgi:serine/threonine protein kinase